ncbi:MAG: hypothetical protein MZV64_04890 [Ignavibacteriales bacterium]|nr:hypothetical protein [Ignavibacteriales bacterium]
MPSDWAIRMNSLSRGTVLTLPTASASGTRRDLGRHEGDHHPVLAALQRLHGPGPVGHPQLLVHGRRVAAPGPGTDDERRGCPPRSAPAACSATVSAARPGPGTMRSGRRLVSHRSARLAPAGRRRTAPLRPPPPAPRAAGQTACPSASRPDAGGGRGSRASAPRRRARQCRPAAQSIPPARPRTSTTAIFRADRAA